MLLSVLYYRPDFDDDDDEGNKLFRYLYLSQCDPGWCLYYLLSQQRSQCFLCFSSDVMMKQQASTMTKSALPGRRMNWVKQMCVDGVSGNNTNLLFLSQFLFIYFYSYFFFFFSLKVIFEYVFQLGGFISRSLEEDQSFADKEKLARYGLYHYGRLPHLLVSILNALIKSLLAGAPAKFTGISRHLFWCLSGQLVVSQPTSMSCVTNCYVVCDLRISTL